MEYSTVLLGVTTILMGSYCNKFSIRMVNISISRFLATKLYQFHANLNKIHGGHASGPPYDNARNFCLLVSVTSVKNSFTWVHIS